MEYRASQVGSCPQLLSYLALGYELEEPSSYQRKIFDEGHDREDRILAKLEEDWQAIVTNRQAEVRWQLAEDLTIVGHIDGIMQGQSLSLVEAKAMGAERYAKFLEKGVAGFPLYRTQLACYWAGWHQPEAGNPPLTGIILAVQHWQEGTVECQLLAADYCEQMTADVEKALVPMLQEIATLAEHGKVLERREPGEFGCGKCGGRYHCYPELMPILGETDDVVTGLMGQWIAAKQAQMAANSALLVAGEELEAWLDEKAITEVSTVLGRAQWVQKKDSRRLNSKAVEAKFSEDELGNCYEAVAASRYLKVTTKGQSE